MLFGHEWTSDKAIKYNWGIQGNFGKKWRRAQLKNVKSDGASERDSQWGEKADSRWKIREVNKEKPDNGAFRRGLQKIDFVILLNFEKFYAYVKRK